MLAPIDTATLAGQRDRALLLLGFAAALRRSELVALDVEDLAFDTARGLKLTIRKSKTDQQQAGAQVAIPYARETDRCAIRALSQWLQAAKIHRGPVFRRMRRGDTVGQQRLTDQSVALIIKSRARTAPLPAELPSSPGTRCAPATRPPPRPPGSRTARSRTSPVTRTSPSCAATSAQRRRSTTSAKSSESFHSVDYSAEIMETASGGSPCAHGPAVQSPGDEPGLRAWRRARSERSTPGQ